MSKALTISQLQRKNIQINEKNVPPPLYIGFYG